MKYCQSIKQLWLLVLPLALLVLYVYTDPFKSHLSEKKIPLSGLTVHQRLNIQRAAEKIDGIVLRPGEQFSFNQSVGPRTNGAGFYAAPSYIGAGSYNTVGGGICVVSSALYQAALLAGVKVTERVAHLRTMQTVEPGLDATVWYGGADLKFVNDQSSPMQIQCRSDDDYLTVGLAGAKRKVLPLKLTRREIISGNNQVAVEVFQEGAFASAKLLSRDIYAINSPKRSLNLARHTVN